jgi:chromosomal replication initiation ATPase DnaA
MSFENSVPGAGGLLPPPPKSPGVPPDVALATVRDFCAAAFGVSALDVGAPTRRRADAARARQMAMYLLHVVFGYSAVQVARLFGRDRSTVEHAFRMMEDMREDAAQNAFHEALEAAVTASVLVRGGR